MSNFHQTRASTRLLMQMMDEGLLDPRDLAEQLMMWMSEHEVTQLVHHYEYDTMQGAYEE